MALETAKVYYKIENEWIYEVASALPLSLFKFYFSETGSLDPYFASTSSLRRPPQLKVVGVDFKCRFSDFSKKIENSFSRKFYFSV